MPHRVGNLYENIIKDSNIRRAHFNAKQDKSFYSAVIYTENHLDERMSEIQKILANHTYKVSPYNTSIIFDKNKKRILYKLPYYPDRIIQWAIMLQMEPVFMKTFSDFSCASVKGRGSKKASDMVRKWLCIYPEETKYCLKLDVKKFYPSIDHEILKHLLRRKFKDKDLLLELDKIIDSIDDCDVSKLDIPKSELKYYTQKGKGLPVGSYLSQYLANYYLTFFDHWLKEELHCKFVVRYMDDIIIFGKTKEELWEKFYRIKDYLQDLKLEVKSNYQVFPVDARGVDFVGYRHFRGYTLMRKSTLKRFKKLARDINKKWYKQQFQEMTDKEWFAFNSYLGRLKWCDGQRFFYGKLKWCYAPINWHYCMYICGKKSYDPISYYRQIKKDPYKRVKNIKRRSKKYYNDNYSHKRIHKRGKTHVS